MSTEFSLAPAQEADWEDLAVEHLQLAPRICDGLRKRGIDTVGKALSFSRSNTALQFPYAPELFECFQQATDSRATVGIDWRKYWELRGRRFQQLAACLSEFDNLAEALSGYAIDRRSLGNAGAMLKASGIRTFPQLIEGLRRGLGSVRGIGRTKIAELFDRLFELTDRVERGRLNGLNRLHAEARDGEPEPSAGGACLTPPPAVPSLPEDVRRLPIATLQLGTKSRWLQRAGMLSVGDVADADRAGLTRIPGIGRLTVEAIEKKLEELASSSTAGCIDWDAFSRHSGLPLIPSQPLASGAEMLARLPEIVGAIAPHLKDDSYRAILSQRLTKGPGSQSTLEELGRQARPAVTRERIRQKEKKLLSQLAGALIWDVDGRLGVQFHPTMLEFWRKAASEFDGEEEIRFDQFIHRLSVVWNVEREALIRELPFIVAVVTGDPQIPAAFRAGARLNPILFGLSDDTAALSITRFRIGKLAARLERRGIVTLGALVAAAADGLLNPEITALLSSVASAVQPDGRIDWPGYATATELRPLPTARPRHASDFAAGFCSTVVTLLTMLHTSDRRSSIFRLRTSLPLRSRPTLDAVAQTLATYGPGVKREETELLQELHGILVDRDFSGVPVWLDDEWLRHLRIAEGIFQHSGSDYAVFLSRLSDAWEISLEETEQASPGLWAIFTGYPEGPKGGKPKTGPAFEIVPVEPARIRLRGFRRLH